MYTARRERQQEREKQLSHVHADELLSSVKSHASFIPIVHLYNLYFFTFNSALNL